MIFPLVIESISDWMMDLCCAGEETSVVGCGGSALNLFVAWHVMWRSFTTRYRGGASTQHVKAALC